MFLDEKKVGRHFYYEMKFYNINNKLDKCNNEKINLMINYTRYHKFMHKLGGKLEKIERTQVCMGN